MAISWLIQNEFRSMGNSGPLVFMTASKPATVEMVEQVERGILAVAAQHGPVSFLMVIRPNRADRVTPEARDRLAKMLKAIAPVCLGRVTVVDAGGLLGTIVRATLTGLSILTAGNGYPTKVAATIPEALYWLAAVPRQDKDFFKYRREVADYFAEQQKLSA
jgi:hypothetical protein